MAVRRTENSYAPALLAVSFGKIASRRTEQAFPAAPTVLDGHYLNGWLSYLELNKRTYLSIRLPSPNRLQMSNSRDITSQSLIARVRGREQDAWHRFVELYEPLVKYWCRKAGLKNSDAADLSQEVFQAVAKSIGKFSHDQPGATFRGWLRTIFRRRLADFLERRNKSPHAAGGTGAWERLAEIAADDETDAEETSITSGIFHRVLDFIQAEFQETTWRAFWLTTVEERSAAEVARVLEISPGAVHTAKWRVLRRVRQELGDLE